MNREIMIWCLWVVGLVALVMLFISNQTARKFISLCSRNAIMAVFLIYGTQIIHSWLPIGIPFNGFTLSVVHCLGISGLFVLIALKFILI